MTNDLTSRARQLRRDSTEAERCVWHRLRAKQILGCKFRRQVPLGPYIVDFVCHEVRLIVEVDGGQHLERVGADQDRTGWLNERGYKVLRFWNHQVLNEIEAVLEVIAQACRKGRKSSAISSRV